MDEFEQAFRDALKRADTEVVPVPPLDPAEFADDGAAGRPARGAAVRWLALVAAVVVVAGIGAWAVWGRGVRAEPVAPAAPIPTSQGAAVDLADTSIARVEVDIFSGRENPVVELDAAVAEQIELQMVDHMAAGEFGQGVESPTGTGFRGFLVYPVGETEPQWRIIPDAIFREATGESIKGTSYYNMVWDAIHDQLPAEVQNALPDTSPAIPDVKAELPPQLGDTATWVLAEPDSPTRGTSLELYVQRLSCSNGRTGAVMEPVFSISDTDIVIRVDAVPLPEGAYNCLGNNWVTTSVTLPEPVGDRTVYDAACLAGDAVRTAVCEAGAVRWAPGITPPGLPDSGATDVQLRVRNDTEAAIEDVQVAFLGTDRFSYPDLEPGAESDFQVVEGAYRYGWVQVTVAGKHYTLMPTDYVGEKELKPGYYTFALSLRGEYLDLALEINA